MRTHCALPENRRVRLCARAADVRRIVVGKMRASSHARTYAACHNAIGQARCVRSARMIQARVILNALVCSKRIEYWYTWSMFYWSIAAQQGMEHTHISFSYINPAYCSRIVFGMDLFAPAYCLLQLFRIYVHFNWICI